VGGTPVSSALGVNKFTMPPFLETVLPTILSRWLLAGSIPLALASFAFPSYLPSEVWAIQSLHLLQMRLLLATVSVLLCMFGSFVSVLMHHKKISSELAEIKKYMKSEQLIAFSKHLNEINKNNHR
jgi:hypothetical protein